MLGNAASISAVHKETYLEKYRNAWNDLTVDKYQERGSQRYWFPKQILFLSSTLLDVLQNEGT